MNIAFIGHMQIGLLSDLIGGGSVAANIVILALPNLVLTCGFPWAGLPCRYYCDLHTYTPIWPDSREWQQMRADTAALPQQVSDVDLFHSLAEKIEFRPLLR